MTTQNNENSKLIISTAINGLVNSLSNTIENGGKNAM